MNRPKSLLLIIALATATLAVAQPKDCKECIPWSADRPLQWSDFKGRPSASSPNKAMTDSGMSISFSCDGSTAEVSISSYFSPYRSWTKTKDSDRLLAHEQLHFDITELFVRKLRKEISALETDCEKMNRAIEKLYDSNYQAYAKYQAQYDRETKHSLIEEEQLRWEQLVADELKALEDFRKE